MPNQVECTWKESAVDSIHSPTSRTRILRSGTLVLRADCHVHLKNMAIRNSYSLYIHTITIWRGCVVSKRNSRHEYDDH